MVARDYTVPFSFGRTGKRGYRLLAWRRPGLVVAVAVVGPARTGRFL